MLTDQEEKLARLVAEGLSNKAIEERLHISSQQLEAELTRLYTSLGVSGRVELLLWYFSELADRGCAAKRLNGFGEQQRS